MAVVRIVLAPGRVLVGLTAFVDDVEETLGLSGDEMPGETDKIRA